MSDSTRLIETKRKFDQVLLSVDREKVADTLDIKKSEVSRKINGNNGWSNDQLVKVISLAGAQIVPGDGRYTVVLTEEYEATKYFAQKGMALAG